MPGINREDAAAAIAAGWSQQSLLRLHGLINKPNNVFNCNEFGICKYLGWGFYVTRKNDFSLMIYKGMTVREIDLAFNIEEGTDTEVICYTDGSGTKADKPSGSGVVIYRSDEKPIFIARNVGLGTNNHSELMALWLAIRYFPNIQQKIRIFSDSEYAMGSVNLANQWTAKKNIELIRCIREDLTHRGDRVTFEWVNGHKGIEGNEIADRLANIGRKIIQEVTIW